MSEKSTFYLRRSSAAHWATVFAITATGALCECGGTVKRSGGGAGEASDEGGTDQSGSASSSGEAVFSSYVRHSGGTGGALLFVHRFGGSLNLKPHLHAVVADGGFRTDGAERACIVPIPPPEPFILKDIAFTVWKKFLTWLTKQQLIEPPSEPNDDALSSCLRGSIALEKPSR